VIIIIIIIVVVIGENHHSYNNLRISVSSNATSRTKPLAKQAC